MKHVLELLERRSLRAAIQPDLTFDIEGSTALQFAGPAVMVREVADGKILAVGTRDPGGIDHVALIRRFSDGALDHTFFPGGVLETPVLGSAIAATVDSHGRMFVLVRQGNSVVVARFKPSGALDKTFSGNGRAEAVASSTPVAVGSITIQSDGKV